MCTSGAAGVPTATAMITPCKCTAAPIPTGVLQIESVKVPGTCPPGPAPASPPPPLQNVHKITSNSTYLEILEILE